MDSHRALSTGTRDLRAGLLPFAAFLAFTPTLFAGPQAPASTPGARVASRTTNDAPPAVQALPKPELPPLPAGVEELNFAEFFQVPVGPRGLEVSERLKALDGKRVRIFGYMVHEDLTACNSCPVIIRKGKRPPPAWMEMTVPGRMLLTAAPASISHAHYGLADDLPPQTLFVTVPDRFGELVPYTPGPMLLTGVLSVGNRDEPDGRISVARLQLEPPGRAGSPTTSFPSNTQIQSKTAQK